MKIISTTHAIIPFDKDLMVCDPKTGKISNLIHEWPVTGKMFLALLCREVACTKMEQGSLG